MGRITRTAMYRCHGGGAADEVGKAISVPAVPGETSEQTAARLEAAARAREKDIPRCPHAQFARFARRPASRVRPPQVAGYRPLPGQPCDLRHLPASVEARRGQIVRWPPHGEEIVRNQLLLLSAAGATDSDVCSLVSQYPGWEIIARLSIGNVVSYQLEYRGARRIDLEKVAKSMSAHADVTTGVSPDVLLKMRWR